jgi:CheY-like chemotaxis protein
MPGGMSGLRVLVVEDIFIIADGLGALLRESGCEVVGPVAQLEQALALAGNAALDGAILDINLDGQPCFPIDAILSERGIPYIFVTGYANDGLPVKYRGIPRLTKPFDPADLVKVVAREFARVA